MVILVTGCAGFIGSQLCARLLSVGHAVRGLDCFDETLYPAARHRAQLTPLLERPGFSFTEGDIADAALLSRQVAGCEVVVHLAALAGVRPSLHRAADYMRVNVEGTQRVLDAVAAARVPRLVFASSSSVYGARSAVPFRETDEATQPASPYAASKRAGELLCATHSALHGATIAALRFFTVYGPHQRPEMAVAKFARCIRRGDPVTLYGGGDSARDYTYIEDILDGVLLAIARTAAPVEPFRVYNLGGAQTTTLRRLVELLEAALGRRAELDWQPPQAGDVPITYADTTRAGAELGYAPRVELAEGIARYCAFVEQHPEFL